MEQGEGQKPGRRREPTGELVGSYAVISQIASGEATTVHLAQKQGALGFHRLAAIKRLKPAFVKNSEWKQLLLDEARISAGVHHVNIVDVIDVGTDNGCYLVMDYVEGSDLAELLARAGKERHPRYVLPPIVDALHGLHAAHTALDEEGEPLGLVHQAPTARHMLLGIDGTARLTDFSQVSAQGLLPSHLRYGRLKSPHMAPEQLRGNNPVDARTDVFVVGITLWEALTGERLFHADTMELSRRAVLERHIPRPSDVGLRPPRALDALCLRALARNPDERFQSAAEMARELRDIGLNEALFATSGEVGQWVRALAGRALIERRRAIGADAPSAELAIDTLTLDEGGSLTGSSATGGLAGTPSRVGPTPLPPLKPANDRGPVAGEPSRVTRLYTVAVAAPPGSSSPPSGSSAPPSGSSLPGSGTLLGAPRIEPAELRRGEDASRALDVRPSPKRPGDRRDSAQPSPGAYRHIASDRRGLATLPETAGPRAEPVPKLSALASRLAGESPDEPDESPPVSASAPKSPGTALALSSASRPREEAAYRAPAAPRTQWPDEPHGAGQGRFAEADGSLRPPNRAHMDFADDEERESSSGLGFIAVLSAAIIVLAGVVGIRQWSAERELERSGRSAASAPRAEPAVGAPTVEPTASPTALPPAVAAAGSNDASRADAGAAGAAAAGTVPAVAGRRQGPQPVAPRPALRKPITTQPAASQQFAPQRPPMRGPGADLPVKQHVGLPDNPY